MNKPIVIFDFRVYADGYLFIQLLFHPPFILVQYDDELLTGLTVEYTPLKSFLPTVFK